MSNTKKPYTVTDEDGDYQREIASTYQPSRRWASDIHDAAREWAEEVHGDMECPKEMTAIVTDPDGKRYRVGVGVEMEPHFYTGQSEELP